MVEDFACPVCNEKTVVKDRKRFISYPTCLAFVLKRIVYDDWVPIKLLVELQITLDGDIDLKKYAGNNAEI